MNGKTEAPDFRALTEADGAHSDMLMDIGLLLLREGERRVFLDGLNETAFLLLEGSVTLSWEERRESVSRTSVFDEGPCCLHVPRGTRVDVEAGSGAELLIQKTANGASFPSVLYTPELARTRILGEGGMLGAARRVLRDIFNYGNAPYSNMVMGELITLPGKWSSYPPHHHPQPEVYYYRFDRPQGFGVSIIGDSARIVRHNDLSAIPGGLCHPQVSAPGYAMYYCWMIRHLDGNPWTDRIDDPDHAWLHDPNAVIWEEKA